MSLFKTQISSSIKWSALSQGCRQAMQLGTTIVLARLLSPSDFGLVGMVSVLVGFVSLFKDLGTSVAVIQQKDLSDELTSSIFWLNLFFGFIAMLTLHVCSTLAAGFYHEPRIAPLIELLSITLFISGFGVVHQAILERNLAFDRLAKIETVSTLLGAIVGIGSATIGYGVWSLIYQTLAVSCVTTILLFVYNRWRPQTVFRWMEIKSVSRYSLNLTGFNLLNYFSRNADYLLIGRFLGAQDLGYYTLAYRIMLYPVQNVSSIIGRVMFPFYSQIQDNNPRLRHSFLNVASTISLITFPMMMGLMVIGPSFVQTFWGQQWAPVALLLTILAPVGMAQSIGSTVGAIYQAKGRTDWMFRWGAGASALAVFAFVLGLPWGIVGVATAYAIAAAILIYPSFAIPFKLIELPMIDMGKVLWRPFVSGAIMFAILIGVRMALPTGQSSGLVLGILIPVGMIAYLMVSFVLNKERMLQTLNTLKIQG